MFKLIKTPGGEIGSYETLEAACIAAYREDLCWWQFKMVGPDGVEYIPGVNYNAIPPLLKA